MRALHFKLLREVWRHRGQLMSIGAVVSVGIMMVLTMRGAYESLVVAKDQYYRDSRFPDVWAQLERAPESLRSRIEEIPGVAVVDTRVTFASSLDLPDVEAPALGRFASLPDEGEASLARIHVVTGRTVAEGRRDEVVISKKFAIANGFRPGDTVRAVINGRLRDLAIVGTAISPEYTYAVPPGSIYPDDKRFGLLWMSRSSLGPAYDLERAFNEVALTLAYGADRNHVIADLDRLLAPYGGLGAYGREDQVSHQILQSEMDSQQSMGTAIPAVFLMVAAFLLNIVLGRMIATQRTEIAVLKAFGYSNGEIGRHYLSFAMAAVAMGSALGIALGIPLGGSMVALYGQSFDFPALDYEVSGRLIAIAVGVSALAAVIGALGAVRKAVALPPAEAMRPESPARFGPGIFERMGLGRLLPAAGRMILRNIERKPMRSVFSMVGVAFSVAILVIGLFMFDGVDFMMRLQFGEAQREDLSLNFNLPLSQSVRHDLAHLEGVTRVEPFRSVPVRLVSGHHERVAAITGSEPDARLRRIVTANGRVQPLPPEGMVMSSFLATKLEVETGDRVRVELLEGDRRTAEVIVVGVVEDFLGVGVYMDLDALHHLAGGPRSISGAYLAVLPHARAALGAELKQVPAIAGVASPALMLASFQKQLADGLFIGVFFILAFSSVISIAVIYNGARVSLSERGRELASLRVLGFSRREVAVLLLGEQAITTLLALPLGWALGYAMAAGVSASIQTELYRIPFVISPATFGYATGATLVAALLSGWIVRRRLDRMDLIEVLKTRE